MAHDANRHETMDDSRPCSFESISHPRPSYQENYLTPADKSARRACQM